MSRPITATEQDILNRLPQQGGVLRGEIIFTPLMHLDSGP